MTKFWPSKFVVVCYNFIMNQEDKCKTETINLIEKPIFTQIRLYKCCADKYLINNNRIKRSNIRDQRLSSF